MPGLASLELAVHGSIRDIGRAQWTELAGPEAEPFLAYDWLEALERNGRVAPERGWAPLYLALSRAGQIVATAPGYVKGNSEGEFVFDHAWARFSREHFGLEYYPKLIVAIPFTPATSARLLVRSDQDPQEMAEAFVLGLGAVCQRFGLSSAHVLFPSSLQADMLAGAGMLHRLGLQYQWRNAGYSSFDDFLQEFSAKRRAQIRRERRALEAQGIRLEVVTGAALTESMADLAYDLYCSTVDKFYWGRRYLDRGFFRDVCARMPEQIHLVVARNAAARPIAGAFNLLGRDALFGRYWGAFEEHPFLHFNVCYYAGIEDCIRRGLRHFEPGAGGEHKHPRGFEPAVTHSVHLLMDDRLEAVVADFLRRERKAIHQALGRLPSYVRSRAPTVESFAAQAAAERDG